MATIASARIDGIELDVARRALAVELRVVAAARPSEGYTAEEIREDAVSLFELAVTLGLPGDERTSVVLGDDEAKILAGSLRGFVDIELEEIERTAAGLLNRLP